MRSFQKTLEVLYEGGTKFQRRLRLLRCPVIDRHTVEQWSEGDIESWPRLLVRVVEVAHTPTGVT